MKKKVADLTVDELKSIIEETVDERFVEWFGDPDEGLELKPEIIKRLQLAMRQMRRGEGIPLEKVAKEMGIKLKK